MNSLLSVHAKSMHMDNFNADQPYWAFPYHEKAAILVCSKSFLRLCIRKSDLMSF